MECFNAAADGNLDLLRQLRESGYSWDKWTCTGAALHGHLETLQWAIANGCDHDHEFVLTSIARKACAEEGVFPGYGCLVADCPDTAKNEGLCIIHKAAICSILLTLVCNDVAQLILEIVCAPN